MFRLRYFPDNEQNWIAVASECLCQTLTVAFVNVDCSFLNNLGKSV